MTVAHTPPKHASGSVQAGLDWLYAAYNARRYVHPDPLELVYRYDDPADREIAGLISACMAFGQVGQILVKAGEALDRLGPPRRTLLDAGRPELAARFGGFRYRFVGEAEMTDLLWGAARVIRRHGSLERCFLAGYDDRAPTITPALAAFVGMLRAEARGARNYLLPDPAAGSACKRLHLYLRWMVRRDAVDPGGWSRVRARQLVAPVDVHMHRLGRALGFTKRRQADARTALEITAALRRFAPHDPVRYDFALTRLGIRDDARLLQRFQEFTGGAARLHQ